MLLASEARKQAKEIIYKHNTDELKKIDSEIKQAVLSGKMEYSFEGHISDDAKLELERCGYIIHIGSQYNECYVNIKW